MIGIYTANFNHYDDPMPIEPLPGIVYRYFTDDPTPISGWQVVHVDPLPCATSKHSSRYFFDQSCLVMPDCEYTILHSANSCLVADPRELIATYITPFADMALFRHPHRDCIYDEAKAIISLKKDNPDTVHAHMARVEKTGMPRNYGLSACTFMIRHNTPRMRAFEDAWWYIVSTGSHRDQLSFDLTRWWFNFPVNYIPGDVFASPHILTRRKHAK